MAIIFDTLEVGDYFTLGRHFVNDEEPWPLEWVIVHKASTYQIAMTRHIIDLRGFDAKEASNGDSNRKSYGNNRWLYSNIRQWLNANARAGWYAPAHSADAQPIDANFSTTTGYAMRPGFLSNFTPMERSIIIPSPNVTVKANVDGGGAETVTDLVWLPSFTEMGFGNLVSSSPEGVKFSLFKDNAAKIATVHPNVLTNTATTSKPANTHTAWDYWMRSPLTGNSHYVYFVHTSGGSGDYYAYFGSCGLRPCIRVPLSGRYETSTSAESGIIVDMNYTKIVMPSSATVEGLSAIRDVAIPAVTITPYVAWNDPIGANLKVYACNNAYDASPKWEDVTTAYYLQSNYTLTNTTKTASKWGIQLKVVVTRGSAAAVSIPACAFALV